MVQARSYGYGVPLKVPDGKMRSTEVFVLCSATAVIFVTRQGMQRREIVVELYLYLGKELILLIWRYVSFITTKGVFPLPCSMDRVILNLSSMAPTMAPLPGKAAV